MANTPQAGISMTYPSSCLSSVITYVKYLLTWTHQLCYQFKIGKPGIIPYGPAPRYDLSPAEKHGLRAIWMGEGQQHAFGCSTGIGIEDGTYEV
jgi:hypothetical protein